jgi:NAD(P)H-nitrite reductase large subunit
MLAFNDARRGIAKRALIEDDRLAGALLCNETRATDWLLDLIARGGSTAELRKWLFAPLATPPAAGPARGRIVCNCFDVSENEIRAELAAGLDLAALQAKTQVRQQLRLLPAGAQAHGRTIGGCGAGQRLTKQRAGLIGWKQAP